MGSEQLVWIWGCTAGTILNASLRAQGVVFLKRRLDAPFLADVVYNTWSVFNGVTLWLLKDVQVKTKLLHISSNEFTNYTWVDSETKWCSLTELWMWHILVAVRQCDNIHSSSFYHFLFLAIVLKKVKVNDVLHLT